jgi:hypothetical protein
MIGNLLYVTTSRPDIMQEVGHVAQFQVAPKESHVLALKRIFRYFKQIKDFNYGIQKERIYNLFPT